MSDQLLKDYISIFKEKKIKLTDIRMAILKCIASRRHFTINELIFEIEKTLGAVNVMSVYNNIDLLLELHLVFSNTINGKQIIYEAVSSQLIHTKCHECGSYEHIESSSLSRDMWSLFTQVLESKKFTLDHFKLELHGICQECQAKQKKQEL